MSTIAAANLSEEIIVTQFRDRLRTEAGDGTKDLDDPKSGSRGSGDPSFIVTSFPDDHPFYPHVVVREAGDTGRRPDRRVDIHQHTYLVEALVLAASATNLFSIRDGIRNWFENNIETLGNNGYQDGEIASSTPANWEADLSVETWQLTFTGEVFTT